MYMRGGYGLVAAAAMGALAGCTAAAPTGTQLESAGTGRFFAGSGDAGAAKAIGDGNKLQADPPMAVGGYARGVYGVPGRIDRGSSFALVKNDKGGVDMTVNGETIAFTGNERQGGGFFRMQADGLAKQGHPWKSQQDKSSYSELWSYAFEESLQSVHSGFAVVGVETKPDVLANKPSATYRGGMGGETHAGPMQGDWHQLVSKGPDSTVLNVQFGANPTISGTITNMRIADATGQGSQNGWGPFRDMAGTLTLESAPITGNGFEGKLTADQAFKNEVGFANFDNGKYAGRFYGPNGEEAAGVISGDNNVGSQFIGGFRAWE
jgi:hypothetical protein